MPYLLTKLNDKPNKDALYRLEVTHESFSVLITYKTFRRVLESYDWSPHRIAYVLKLLDRLYPIETKKDLGFKEDRYTDKELIQLLEFHGFKVCERKHIDVVTAIKILEKRGYMVSGYISGTHYQSPIFFNN